MPKVPLSVQDWPLTFQIKAAGLNQLHMGKVRHTFNLSDHSEKNLSAVYLPVASDRVSIFDFVLNATIPEKGMVLNALTIHWLTTVLGNVPNHLIAFGSEMDKFLPYPLRNKRELQQRGLLVKKLNMLPVECIVRFHLTGSGLVSYKETSQVCGHTLAPGLYDGAILPHPLFTPSTKAEEGHDVNISHESVNAEFGNAVGELSLDVARKVYGSSKINGIILADTKLEFGTDPETGILTLGDEIGTPDSSRFWHDGEWVAIQTKPIQERSAPTSYDKEYVRSWGKKVETPFTDSQGKTLVGIHKLDPLNYEHLAFVHGLTVPPEILQETSDRYLQIFHLLTGKSLYEFQKEVMGIR